MKKILLAALALAPAAAFGQSMVITLNSGEVVKFPVSEISRMAFAETIVTPPEVYVPFTDFTDPVLREAVAAFDKDGDAQLSEAEIAEITEINLSSSDVESLAGIEKLVDLKELDLASCSKLKEVDLSAGLEKLEILQVGLSSNLATLKLGSKPALKGLFAQNTAISELDLSGAPVVEELSISSTKITSFAYSGTSLNYFSAGSEVLESLDLKGCDNLVTLSINTVPKMDALDTSAFPKLESLTFTGSKIKTFDTSANPNLASLTLNNNESLTTLDVSKSMQLNYLSCYSCWDLAKVIMTEGQVIGSTFGVSSDIIEYVERVYPEDIASTLTNEAFRNLMLSIADTDGDGKITKDEALAVTTVNGSGKNLTEVDFTYFNNIVTLDLSNNNLTSVALWPMLKLQTLNVNNNKLTSLDVSRQSEMAYLYASHNEISTLSSFAGRQYVEMDFSHNKLKDVKITYFGKLLKVDVSYNELTQAQILGNDNQTDLDVSHNQLTEMTLWSLKKLVNAKFNDNPFIQLNEANRWTQLEDIDVANTQIPTLDLSKTTVLKKCVATGCPNLTTIYIGENTSAEIVKDANTTVVEGAPAE